MEENIIEKTPLVMLSDAAIRIEKVRVAAEVRLSHLAKRGSTCPDTKELLKRSENLEKWVDDRLADIVKSHPAAPWFTRVKGTGGEAIGKVLGHIEAFGRFYDQVDSQIPSYVKRPPIIIDGKPKIWVKGIERFTTPSKLRKYAGLSPGAERKSGRRLEYNIELRAMLWRLGTSLLRAKGKYYEFYLDYKKHLLRRFEEERVKVEPTPKNRYCPVCKKEVVRKTARFCPDCNSSLTLKKEPEGVKWEGHLAAMASRRMLQLFLDHLWVVWRKALNLPLRDPYPIEYQGHSQIISPWDMTDR